MSYVRSMLRRALPVIGVALPLVAGCGGGTSDKSKPAAGPHTRTITVEETEYKVTPSTRRFPVGHIVFRAVNKGTIPHALEIEGPGSENETATIQPGGSSDLELNIRAPGKWEFHCPLDGHEKKGMVTHFVVTPAK